MKKHFYFIFALLIFFSGCSLFTKDYVKNKKENENQNRNYYINAINKSNYVFIGLVKHIDYDTNVIEKNNDFIRYKVSNNVRFSYEIIKILYQNGELNEKPYYNNRLHVYHNYKIDLNNPVFKKNKSGEMILDKKFVTKIKIGKKYIVFMCKDKKESMTSTWAPFPRGALITEKGLDDYFKYYKNLPKNVAFSDYGEYLRKTNRYTKANEKYIINLIKEIKDNKDKNKEKK